jgi:hypothetical protein
MPGTTPLQLYQYPTTADQASPAGIQVLAQAMEKQVVAVFADASTRDTRWPTAGGLADGAMCFLADRRELQLRTGGAWVVIGGRNAPYAHASNTANYNLNGVSNVSINVTFPTNRFSLAPIVMATHQSAGGGSQALTLRPFNITATGCTINIAHVSLSTTTVTGEQFSWAATQMTSIAQGG